MWVGNYSALQKQENSAIDLDELRKLLKSRDHQRVIHPNGFGMLSSFLLFKIILGFLWKPYLIGAILVSSFF